MINHSGMLESFQIYKNVLNIDISDKFDVELSVTVMNFQTRPQSTYLVSAINTWILLKLDWDDRHINISEFNVDHPDLSVYVMVKLPCMNCLMLQQRCSQTDFHQRNCSKRAGDRCLNIY